jgi:hypothetical protein
MGNFLLKSDSNSNAFLGSLVENGALRRRHQGAGGLQPPFIIGGRFQIAPP